MPPGKNTRYNFLVNDITGRKKSAAEKGTIPIIRRRLRCHFILTPLRALRLCRRRFGHAETAAAYFRHAYYHRYYLPAISEMLFSANIIDLACLSRMSAAFIVPKRNELSTSTFLAKFLRH